MKLITISKIGYNHPSQANWSWGIWKIDTIDTKKSYCMSYTVKENFGGDSRLRAKVRESLKYEIIETKGVLGTPNITGVSKMQNMEDQEVFNLIKNFLNN